MNKQEILTALKQVNESAKKRNFKQTYDLFINLKELDLKKPEHKVDLFLALPHNRGKELKICALVDKDLQQEAKQCDKAILKDEFPLISKNPKEVKKLAINYDFFIAQANIMPDIAKHFGKILGQRGKMPNPKAGCVVPPKIILKPLIEKLKKTIRVQTKNDLTVRIPIGKEGMKDEDLAENIEFIYNNVLRVLPGEVKNIKNIMLKLTMGKPILIGENQVKIEVKKEKKKVEAQIAEKEAKKEEVKETPEKPKKVVKKKKEATEE